jgi:FkbM family methyltransferase
MKPEPFLRRSSRLVRRLGVPGGLRASYLLATAKTRTCTARQLHIPQTPNPIWLRDGGSDFAVMEQVFVPREYDFTGMRPHHAKMQAVYAALLDRGTVPVIIDCGANIGFSSIWFALKYPQAIIYAVEPESQNFAMLRRNISAYPNITPVHAGISDRVGKVSLCNPAGESWAYRTEEDEAGEVATVTVPGLLGLHANGAPLIVKIDIEGFETSLFRSNTEWAARTSLAIFEMHDWLFAWSGTGHAILRCLTERPRDYLMRGENIFAFAHSDHS